MHKFEVKRIQTEQAIEYDRMEALVNDVKTVSLKYIAFHFSIYDLKILQNRYSSNKLFYYHIKLMCTKLKSCAVQHLKLEHIIE